LYHNVKLCILAFSLVSLFSHAYCRFTKLFVCHCSLSWQNYWLIFQFFMFVSGTVWLTLYGGKISLMLLLLIFHHFSQKVAMLTFIKQNVILLLSWLGLWHLLLLMFPVRLTGLHSWQSMTLEVLQDTLLLQCLESTFIELLFCQSLFRPLLL